MPIELKEKVLNITFPEIELGIVMLQPFIQLDDHSPFKWKTANNEKQNQLAAINQTLQISKKKTHNSPKTHFTIFPEYSIPGLDGISLIDNAVNGADWENGTIIIAGIDGLNKADYQTVCDMANVEVDTLNRPVNLSTNEWVNCIIVWAKQDDGTIRKFIQLKCFKSLQEDHLRCGNMFDGKYINLFECLRGRLKFRFMPFICYDWVGVMEQKQFIWYILEQVEGKFGNTRQELDMVFVIQHNPSPNHNSFMENARDFFTQAGTCQGVIRDKTILVFANTAGGHKPSTYGNYGGSSMIYSVNNPYHLGKCEQTFATSTSKLRNNLILNRCKDTYLRESGSCIHSIRLTLPQTLNLGVDGRAKHLHIKVHPLSNAIVDRRLPNDEVPASIKWINDILDIQMTQDYNQIVKHATFHPSITTNHVAAINEIRGFDDKKILSFIEYTIVDLLIWNLQVKKEVLQNVVFRDRIINEEHMVDHWSIEEKSCLKDLLHLMSILKICFNVDIVNALYHCSIVCKGTLFNLLFVDHITNSMNAVDNIKQYSVFNNNSITILVIKSEDMHLGICNSIYQEIDYTKLPNVTDPSQNLIPVSIIDIKNVFWNSNNINELKVNLLKLIKYDC